MYTYMIRTSNNGIKVGTNDDLQNIKDCLKIHWRNANVPSVVLYPPCDPIEAWITQRQHNGLSLVTTDGINYKEV